MYCEPQMATMVTKNDLIHWHLRVSLDNIFRMTTPAPLKLLIIGAGLCSTVYAAAIPIRFLDPVAHVQPGPKSGTAFLLMRIDAPSKEQKETKDLPSFADFALPQTLAARVQVNGVMETTSPNDSGRTWRVDLVIDGLDPPNTIQRRYSTISWLKQSWDLDYQLSNQPPVDYKWDVVGLPTDWNLNQDRCAPFRISQSAPFITGVSLAATLSDETSKQLLGSQTLFLTADPNQPSPQTDIDAAANSGKPIYLCAISSFFQDHSQHGKFIGAVTITSTQKPDGKAVNLTAYKAGLQSVGIALIILGAIAAYFIKVYAPARLARSRELEPVVLLTDEITKLQDAVKTIPAGKAPIVAGALQQLVTDLSTPQLEAHSLIHRVPPIPFADAIDAAAFVKLLTDSASEIAQINVIVRDGLLPAKAIEPFAPAEQSLIDQTYSLMDTRLSQNSLPTLDQLRVQILADLAQLKTQIQNAQIAAGAPAPAPMPAATPPVGFTFERLQLSIEALSGTIWFFWALLTAVAGIVFQVWMNLSFGRPVDYLYCLLWGFGITAAGQQVSSGLITTGVGVSLPKTN
jgi:hypothetical protein